MGWQDILFQLLIVVSGAPGSGFFVYNGGPGPGNPPVGWIVAPGVTTDPYGNPVQAVAGFGNPAAAHFGINQAGDIFLNNSTPLVIFHGRASDGSFFFYTTAGEGIGHLAASIAAAGTTDAAGNTVQQGITAYSPGTAAYAQLLNNVLNLVFSSTSKWQLSATNTPSLAISDTVALRGVQFADADGTVTLQAFQPGIVSTVETWHTMSVVAGFAAGGTSPRYQFEAINGGRVRLSGAVNLTANQVAGTTFFTLPANYIPSRTLHFVTQNNLSGFALGNASLTVTSGGALQIFPAGTSGNFISLDGVCFELD